MRAKGFPAKPVRAWKGARREARSDSRYEALQAGARRRSSDARKKIRAAALAAGGETSTGGGEVVLLSGEPGIGKSRNLTAALGRGIGGRVAIFALLLLLLAASHRDSALHPIIGQFERAAGFERDDDSI